MLAYTWRHETQKHLIACLLKFVPHIQPCACSIWVKQPIHVMFKNKATTIRVNAIVVWCFYSWLEVWCSYISAEMYRSSISMLKCSDCSSPLKRNPPECRDAHVSICLHKSATTKHGIHGMYAANKHFSCSSWCCWSSCCSGTRERTRWGVPAWRSRTPRTRLPAADRCTPGGRRSLPANTHGWKKM